MGWIRIQDFVDLLDPDPPDNMEIQNPRLLKGRRQQNKIADMPTKTSEGGGAYAVSEFKKSLEEEKRQKKIM